MRAALSDLAVLHYENLIGIEDRAQPVRDRDRGPSPHELRERRLDLRFDLAVDRARRFVEDAASAGSAAIARANDEQLALADTDRRTALAELVVVAVRTAAG